MLIESGSLFAYASVSGFELFILSAFVAGFGEGMVFSSLIVLLSEVVSANTRGAAIGLYRTFMDFGGLIGPVLFLFIFNNLGLTSPFLVAMVILILNASLVATIRKEKQPEIQDNVKPLSH